MSRSESDRQDRTPPVILASSRINRLLQVHFGRLDEPLTIRQYRLLVRVWQGYTSPSELRRMMALSAPTISECCDSLVRRGLITRRMSAQDGRMHVLEITRRGVTAVEVAMDLTGQLAQKVMDRVPPELQAHVAESYESLARAAIEELEAAGESDSATK